MDILLTIISGLFWMIVYKECIRLGFKQKTYCMPFFALGLNLAWEAVYPFSYIFLNAPPPLEGIVAPVQYAVNIVWLILDIVILYTYFKFSKTSLKPSFNASIICAVDKFGLISFKVTICSRSTC